MDLYGLGYLKKNGILLTQFLFREVCFVVLQSVFGAFSFIAALICISLMPVADALGQILLIHSALEDNCQFNEYNIL